MSDSVVETAATPETLEGFGLFGMGISQRLALALTATTLLIAATWWALVG